MTKKEFEIWLIQHDYTHDTLAARLGLTSRTIVRYKSERFPKMFLLALAELEREYNEQQTTEKV